MNTDNNKRISINDEESFSFPGRMEEPNTHNIFLTNESQDNRPKIPVGSVLVGEKAVFAHLDQMRRLVRMHRQHVQANAAVQIEESNLTISQYSWIVRLYRWLRRAGWTTVSLEQIGLIDGLVHSKAMECNMKLVIKNDKLGCTATIIKMFDKSGYLVKCRPISSLLDETNESTKTRIVDTIIQIKNTLKEFSNDNSNDDEFFEI
jgi:hypothetical protein